MTCITIHISTLGIPFVALATLVSSYIFDKTITTDTPKSCEVCILYIFCWLCWQFCLLCWHYAQCFCHASYYSQYYAVIIGSSLPITHFLDFRFWKISREHKIWKQLVTLIRIISLSVNIICTMKQFKCYLIFL